jgi:hypothetical protein
MTFVNVYTQPGGGTCINEQTWNQVTADVTPHKNAAFRIRFCYDVLDAGAFTVGGLSIDDVTIHDPACVTPL